MGREQSQPFVSFHAALRTLYSFLVGLAGARGALGAVLPEHQAGTAPEMAFVLEQVSI